MNKFEKIMLPKCEFRPQRGRSVEHQIMMRKREWRISFKHVECPNALLRANGCDTLVRVANWRMAKIAAYALKYRTRAEKVEIIDCYTMIKIGEIK